VKRTRKVSNVDTDDCLAAVNIRVGSYYYIVRLWLNRELQQELLKEPVPQFVREAAICGGLICEVEQIQDGGK